MIKATPKTAKVMRIHPDGATLTRATGAPVVVGDALSDGETVTLATPTGSGGALTLDRRGVTITIKVVAMPSAGGGLSVVNPFSSAATEVAPSPRPTNMGTAPFLLAASARVGMSSTTAEAIDGSSASHPAPVVKPVVTPVVSKPESGEGVPK